MFTVPLSRTKIATPRRRAELLRRERLIDFLKINIDRKVVFLIAPAGYGKTSLLIDFAYECDFPVVWLAIDIGDQKLERFVNYFVAAIQNRFENFETTAAKLASTPNAQPQNVAITLAKDIRQSLKEPFVIILDDFHLVTDSGAIIEFVDSLLTRLPENVHMIFSGRTILPLDVTSLEIAQQIARLGEEELRFTVNEVQSLYKLIDISLSPTEADYLVTGTQGWIVGILLWQKPIISSRPPEDSDIFNYFREQVFEQQTDDLKNFLLESAVFEEIRSDICDEVLDRSDSEELLRKAESRNLFIVIVNRDPRIYRYIQLFREFLLSKLRSENPGRLRDLEKRVANLTNLKIATTPKIIMRDILSEALSDELTPSYLKLHLSPYLDAIDDVQRTIDEIQGRQHKPIIIKSISQSSPISVSLDGAADAIELIRNSVVPWRRKHVRLLPDF